MYESKMHPMVNAKCPYYLREFKRTLTCEGVTEGSTNTIKFDDEKLKSRYVRQQCFCYPNECPIANTLDKRYLI